MPENSEGSYVLNSNREKFKCTLSPSRKANYNFVSGIKDVISASDNQLGQYGETWVLTNDNYLYLISARSKTVDLVHRNVSKFLVYQQSFASCSYLLLDDHNNLYKCKLDNKTFYKQNKLGF